MMWPALAAFAIVVIASSAKHEDGNEQASHADEDNDGAGGSFPLSFGLHVNDGNGTNQTYDCVHGNWSQEKNVCVCDEHWRLEPFWNTVGLLSGQCTQFACTSDEQCQEALGIEDAECPLPGWNCNCGLEHSAFGNEKGQCMWRYFVLGVSSGQVFALILSVLWKGILVLLVISLPVGANYAGTASEYSCRLLKDDLAWALFSVKFGIWLYCFCVLVYLSLLLLWTLPIVAQFILTVIALGVCCMAAFCDIDGICESSNVADCCAGTAAGDGCLESCLVPASLHAHFAYDPLMFYSLDAYSYHGEYEFGCCSCIKSHFRLLFWNFPRVPENMLGGLIGYCVGTHALSRRERPAAECLVRLLSVPCVTFASRTEVWRQRVHTWLEEETETAMVRANLPSAESAPTGKEITAKIGDVLVEFSGGTFTENEGIFNFDDYQNNLCWICQEGPDREYWDKWTFCSHVFCEHCSTEMIKRRMPCPLCRVRSPKVVRRKKGSFPGSDGQTGYSLILPPSNATTAPTVPSAEPPGGGVAMAEDGDVELQRALLRSLEEQ